MTSVAEVWNCPTVQGVVNQPVLQCRARERHRLGLPSLRMFLMNWGRWAQTRVTWILAIKRILLRLRLRWEMTGMMEVILVSRRSLDRPLHGRSMRSLDEKLDEYNSFFLVRSQSQVHLNSLDKWWIQKQKEKKKSIIWTIDRPDGNRGRQYFHVMLLSFLLAYEVVSASRGKTRQVALESLRGQWVQKASRNYEM